jgi:hypothetical protein
MVLQFKLPPKQDSFFLCIPFKLRKCNLSFLWNCIRTFFASYSNYWHTITSFLLNYIHLSFAYPCDLFFASHASYGQTIFASSLNCSCPFFAYPLKLCAWAFLPDWIHSLLIPKSADCECWNKAYL